MTGIQHSILIGLIGFMAFAPSVQTEDTAQTPEQSQPTERPYLLQIGPHYLSTYTMEEPLLNLAKLWKGEWTLATDSSGELSAAQLREANLIDPETGMPRAIPDDGQSYRGPVLFSAARAAPGFYAGNYVAEWEGSAFGFVQGQPRDLMTRVGANKITFAIRRDQTHPRWLRFSRVKKDGLTDFKVYRNEYRKLIKQGKIWNPRHLKNLRQYDIVRTMDYQSIIASPVTSFDMVARLDDPAWSSDLQTSWPAPPRYGAPYEIFFDLAKEANIALWLHAPPMIGAPFHLSDPAYRDDEKDDRVSRDKVLAVARAHGEAILASPKWEEFAGAVIDRAVAYDYPADRPLYFEVGNEIWNTLGEFGLHTFYADGIGKSINPKWGSRHGYGVLSARWALAFERELAKRNRKQNITYVLAGQTVAAYTSETAITGFQHYLRGNERARDIISKTGISVTNYHSCTEPFIKARFGDLYIPAAFEKMTEAVQQDGEGLSQDLHDFCVNGPANKIMTKNMVLRMWRQHNKVAERAGMQFIGGYEGGSHDTPHQRIYDTRLLHDWWKEFHWGPLGADVNRQVNLALIDAFPGAIISNYGGMSAIGGQPWFDGHYSQDTKMLEMWREFARPGTLEDEATQGN